MDRMQPMAPAKSADDGPEGQLWRKAKKDEGKKKRAADERKENDPCP